jgi:hypothetical protein
MDMMDMLERRLRVLSTGLTSSAPSIVSCETGLFGPRGFPMEGALMDFIPAKT